MPPGTPVVQWHSTLKIGPSIELKAPDAVPWTEVWPTAYYVALPGRTMAKGIGPRAPAVALMRLSRIRPCAIAARCARSCRLRCRRLLRLAFHQSPPQHPDLRIRHHGASPRSISRTRRQDDDYRQFLLSHPADLIVADHGSSETVAIIASRGASPPGAQSLMRRLETARHVDGSVTGIHMRRKKASEEIDRLTRKAKAAPALDELARKAARWGQDNIDRLKGAEPELSTTLDDRAQDSWEPLLAIAILLVRAGLCLRLTRPESFRECKLRTSSTISAVIPYAPRSLSVGNRNFRRPRYLPPWRRSRIGPGRSTVARKPSAKTSLPVCYDRSKFILSISALLLPASKAIGRKTVRTLLSDTWAAGFFHPRAKFCGSQRANAQP